MRFAILGPLEASSRDRLVPLGGPRERTALAMLLLEANRVVPVHRLIDAVWDEAPPATARGQIQICISNLRRRIRTDDGQELIHTRSPGYLLDVADDELDLNRFEGGVAQGRALVASGDVEGAAAAFRQALSLWRGPALFGVDSAIVQPGATRLDERRLVVLGECLDCELRAGRQHEVIGELGQLVGQYPLRENFRALFMTALYRAGRQAEALDCYRRAREVLIDELGLEPGDELRRLHQSILAGDGALELLASVEAGPPHAPEAEVWRPSLLPASIPDFTGRAEIVEQLMSQAADPEVVGRARPAVSVSVIVGQGGAGKTTLALHVAHLLADQFEDGQLFARLRSGDRPVSPSDILERFLRSLGVGGAALPDSVEERAEMFRDLVGRRRTLIILDDAMAEQQVAALLPGTSSCSVIVTSRRRLTGLPSAARVEIGAFPQSSAVDLLSRIVGAERIAAEPESVEQLCTLCGNLPLALRIVAARLAARPHWGVRDLVARLADEPRRLDELHHGEMGVRASISVTYDGLSADARVLLRRLALLESPNFASWVAAPLLHADVLHAEDVLEELTEAYLVNTEPGAVSGQVRYRLHDTMRPFARERLVEESTEDRRAALERWFGAMLALAGEAHRREYSGDFLQQSSLASRWLLPDWMVDRLLADPLAWFEQERSSIVAAVCQAAAGGMAEHAWGLAHNAVTLFESHSYFGDWMLTHEAALKAVCKAGDRRGEAAMRYSIGSLHMFEQRFDAAMSQFELAAEIYVELSDRHGGALVQRNMAYLDRLSGDLDSALARGTEALEIFGTYGDRVAEAHVRQNLAEVRILYGDEDEAYRLLERAALICEQVGNRRVGAQVHHRRGELLLQRGDLDGADAAFALVLDSVRATGDLVGECYALLGVATVQLARGEPSLTQQTLQQAQDLAVSSGERVALNRISLVLAEAELALSELGPAAEHADLAIAGFAKMGAELLRASALTIRGRIHVAASSPKDAAAAWQSAQTILRGLNLQRATTLTVELDNRLAALS